MHQQTDWPIGKSETLREISNGDKPKLKFLLPWMCEQKLAPVDIIFNWSSRLNGRTCQENSSHIYIYDCIRIHTISYCIYIYNIIYIYIYICIHYTHTWCIKLNIYFYNYYIYIYIYYCGWTLSAWIHGIWWNRRVTASVAPSLVGMEELLGTSGPAESGAGMRRPGAVTGWNGEPLPGNIWTSGCHI